MFSTKKNVLQTVALLKAHGIDHIVVSPGSRNAPLIHCFNEDPFFNCFSMVDERSAGYFAIGLINKLQRPVALCCTSGTALLNYAPAVAEAFYQGLPLVVVSADRAPSWIGQMDGQTIPQQGVFGRTIRKSVQLPEVNSEEDLWYCNRLINEALMLCNSKGAGPVHLNIPISEPLFDFSEEKLPSVRKILTHVGNKPTNMEAFSSGWNECCKRMILIGQMPSNEKLSEYLGVLAQNGDCVVLCEHLSNATSPHFMGNFDAVIHTLSDAQAEAFAPDLLITLGGHVVSRRVKKFLRDHHPNNHWHLSPSGDCIDSFQCLTDLIETDPVSFFGELAIRESKDKNFAKNWQKASTEIPLPGKDLPFSDTTVVGTFLQALPEKSALFVGNSSSVRNIQLYPLPLGTKVFCNRGTNGIEGSISTASGYASLHSGLTFLLVGDLSFFYDLNGLWNKHIGKNLRILLINNSGGGIFHLLPDLNQSDALEPYIAAQHQTSAEKWVEAAGFRYMKAESESDLTKNLLEFVDEPCDTAIVLEVFTSPDMNKSAFNLYYHQLKNI